MEQAEVDPSAADSAFSFRPNVGQEASTGTGTSETTIPFIVFPNEMPLVCTIWRAMTAEKIPQNRD